MRIPFKIPGKKQRELLRESREFRIAQVGEMTDAREWTLAKCFPELISEFRESIRANRFTRISNNRFSTRVQVRTFCLDIAPCIPFSDLNLA